MVKIEPGKITFSSGRSIDANQGIIGLSPDLEVADGYDCMVRWGDPEWEDDPLTADDMRELADMMIERWQRFKASL